PRYLDASASFRFEQLGRLLTRDAYRHVVRHDPFAAALGHLRRFDDDWLSGLQYWDLQAYLPLDILTKVDRMSMAHSLEARPPLLDHKLVELAARIPSRLRMRFGVTKYMFKQAVRGLLPDGIVDRPKRGFAVPLARWFRGELAGFARDILLSRACRQRGLFQA